MSERRSGANSSIKGVDQSFRRKWDRDEYERKRAVREREEEEQADAAPARPRRNPDNPFAPTREWLRARSAAPDLDSNVGKTQIISSNTPLSKQGGYYCEVCQCLLKDSSAYLDHINGRRHNRLLGMSMRVQKTTLSEVKGVLKSLKKRKEKGDEPAPTEYSLDRTIAEREEEERERKRAKRKSQPSKSELSDAGNGGEVDDEQAKMMAAMGLPVGFT